MRAFSAFVIALLLVGCSAPEPGAPSAPTSAPQSVQSTPVLGPLAEHPGAEALGFTQPSASLGVDLMLAHVGDNSVVFIDPATADADQVDVAEVSFDGHEMWRQSVEAPDGAEPRLSVDGALGVVGVWFTLGDAEPVGSLTPLTGDVTWFALGTGEGGVIEVEESSEQAWASTSIVGYQLMAEDAEPAQPSAFVFLDPERQERRVERADIGEPFSILGVWGGTFWGALGREAIVAESGVLAKMAPETQYGFWAGTSHFHIINEAGHLQVFDAALQPVFEATNACAAGGHAVTIALGTVTAGELVGDLDAGTTECVDVPDGFELGTVAPDGWAIAKAEAGDPAEPVATKLGRLGEDEWTDLPADTAPRFTGQHAVFVSPTTPGDWRDAVLTAYPVAQFAPE